MDIRGQKNNKETRFALIILMFFGLALLSPYIWNTFDKTKETFAGSQDMGYTTSAGLSPNPSSSYVIKDFFKEINYYEYDEVSKYLFDKKSKNYFINLFKGLYYIEAINIEKGLIDGNTIKHKVNLNTIKAKKNPNKIFDGLETITVSLKKNKANNWAIYQISY